jgi:transcription elongation GreA/GreB family factor
MDKISIKAALLKTCEELLQQRIKVAQNAMQEAQESANGEQKSSAGDKYETSRAMGQIARDMYAKQLSEAIADLNRLKAISNLKPSLSVEVGSVVITEQNRYFLAIGLGKIEVNEIPFFVISPLSPIGALLKGKSKNDSVDFAGKTHKIIEIY